MTRQIHMCQSIRGPLMNWPISKWVNATKYITKTGGEPYRDWRELKDAFLDELAQGHEVIPISKDCEGFDFKTGCPGHDVPDAAEVAQRAIADGIERGDLCLYPKTACEPQGGHAADCPVRT